MADRCRGHGRLWAALTVLVVALAGAARGADIFTYFVLLDTDNNPGTGCTVNGPGGTFSGAEQRLTITVEDTGATATVTGITQAACTGASFGPEQPVSPGDWPVGVGNGLGGADVIEAFVALAAIGDPQLVRVGVLSQGPNDAEDELFTRSGASDGPPMFFVVHAAVTPVAGPWGVAGMVLVLGGVGGWALWRRQRVLRVVAVACVVAGAAAVVWAVTIVLDGQVGDWAGIAPLGTKPAEGTPGVSLVAVFTTADALNLYVRIDTESALAPTPTNTPTDTPTATPSDTPTASPTDTPTATPTSTPTNSPTPCTPSFTDNGNGTITDNCTGLIWEKKSDDGTLHDWNFAYQWAGFCSVTTTQRCQPSAAAATACATGTGDAGTVGCAQCPSGETCNCQGTACNTNGANPAPGSGNYSTIWQWVVWLNSGAGFAGATDWRIPLLLPATPSQGSPTAFELDSLVNTGASGCGSGSPCTYDAFRTPCTSSCTVLTCSCTQPSTPWSATTYTPNTTNAWLVDFYNGVEGHQLKDSTRYVRAVRSGS
jgi:hypothetical protein